MARIPEGKRGMFSSAELGDLFTAGMEMEEREEEVVEKDEESLLESYFGMMNHY